MRGKIKVRVSNFPDRVEKCALIYREVEEPGYARRHEVLAGNGKWRMKGEGDAIFEDEKFPIEET